MCVGLQIKICGLRRPADAVACVQAGVDLAGLNLVPGARRAIPLSTAAQIIAALGSVTPVGVFRDQSTDEVGALAEAIGLRWIQLHGAESPEQCGQLGERFSVIKALTLEQAADSARVAAYAPHICALLIDGKRPGSGQTWDWSALGRTLDVQAWPAERPLWLAGGLDPDNVGAAIAAIQPQAVDTASGVEHDGHLDPARIDAFCRRARAAASTGAP